jgi:Domain of unknown function DUF11
MKVGRSWAALLIVGLLVAGVWLGAAVTGHAAAPQQVTASLKCEPGTVKPEQGQTVGCTLTVSNIGGNNVTKVLVTDKATGGKFLSTTGSLPCTGIGTDTLTCNIAKLAAGAKVVETHELEVATTGEEFLQDLEGRYSPNPNNRNTDTIAAEDKVTILDPDADFDGRFANLDGDSVSTGAGLSEDNKYVTSATVNGTTFDTTFEVGLTVREKDAEDGDVNCPPSGCLGNEVIEFNITPLVDELPDLPDTYTLIITIAGEVVGNTKIEDLVLRHDGFEVGPCTDDPLSDPAGACTTNRFKDPSTKIATFEITGPGDGNGSWGVGGGA